MPDNNIFMIETTKLCPHPQNPRKDLGDLSELADSIKANGIFQNLTVVPWFSEITGQPADNGKMDGEYRVVIGHRRLAAAKLAGLDAVPCVVSNMDHKTQIATMLLENIQRSDLTVLEQAEGFQMMLDLGENVESIAEQTGFSQSTIRRRVKLLDLDPDKFRESVERGGTLEDFAKLDQIKDPELKDRVLGKIGTDNFNYELKNALDSERREALRAKITAQLEEFATPVERSDYATMRYVAGWNFHIKDIAEVEVPEDAGEAEYYYTSSSYGVSLYRKKEAEGAPAQREETEEERQRREVKAAREGITERAFQLRYEFVKGYTGPKKNNPILQEMLLRVFLDDGYFRDELLKDLLDVEITAEDEEEGREFERIYEAYTKNAEKGLLALAYSGWSDSKDRGFFDWYGEYNADSELAMLYDYLERLGYAMSDEEKALRDGTHELFVQPEPEEDEPADDCTLCKSAHPSCEECCAECDDTCNAAQVCRRQADEDDNTNEGVAPDAD